MNSIETAIVWSEKHSLKFILLMATISSLAGLWDYADRINWLSIGLFPWILFIWKIPLKLDVGKRIAAVSLLAVLVCFILGVLKTVLFSGILYDFATGMTWLTTSLGLIIALFLVSFLYEVDRFWTVLIALLASMVIGATLEAIGIDIFLRTINSYGSTKAVGKFFGVFLAIFIPTCLVWGIALRANVKDKQRKTI